MTESTYTSPELARSLNRIEEGQKRLEDKVDALAEKFVLKETYDARLTAVDREIVEIRKSLAPTKTSPWTITSVIISALVGIGSLITVAVLLIKITANVP